MAKETGSFLDQRQDTSLYSIYSQDAIGQKYSQKSQRVRGKPEVIYRYKGLNVSGTARWMGEEWKGWQELAKKTTMEERNLQKLKGLSWRKEKKKKGVELWKKRRV